MQYCRPEKHIFETLILADQVIDLCKNCRCRKIRPDATQRFRDNIRDFGYDAACRMAPYIV